MSGREKSKASPATSPMGRDNKHGWYEEHEKFVAIATRSLSSVLLVGDSMVKGLARYHRVWSKYFEPLRALNFGVGGDRTQHVLWRIENGEIPLNLQVAFVHCGTNNLDRDNPAEMRDGIASIVYTIQEKKPNANIIVSGLLPRDQEISSRRDKIKLVNRKLMRWCRSGKVRNVHYVHYLNTNSDNATHNITAHTDHDINLTTQSFDYNVTTHDNNTTFTETNNNTDTQTPTQM